MKLQKLAFIKYIILPLVLLLLMELIQRGSVFSVLQWPLLHLPEFLASFLLVGSIWAMLLALTNRVKLSFFVILVVTSLFALVSSTKQTFLGEPLLPWDFVLGKETTDIIYYFTSFINLKLIFFFVALVGLGVILFRYVRWGEKSKGHTAIQRVAIFVCALILFCSVYSGKPIPLKQAFGLKSITWDQKLNYNSNGMLLSFLTNMQWLSVEQPLGYHEARITGIMAKEREAAYSSSDYPGSEAEQAPESTVKPNIIMIMNEAFWDPTLLPGVTFSQDPLPFVRALGEEQTSGSLLVPVFGGATVNTEFEVLTGHATGFLPGGSIAYSQYARRPLESLASILSSQGYDTTAIHSYHNWFYRRNHVFHNLGFDKYISAEFMVDPELKRYYISDCEVSRLIIEESQKIEEDQPFFTFAVTMQNHGPYVLGYEEAQLRVEGDISDEAKNILEIYAQGLADADQALKMLVDHFAKEERPTIIVFFGDHLPALGENYQVYRETNYYQDNMSSYAEYQKMHNVPLVIWSNYLAPQEEDLRISTSFLAPYILRQAGLPGSFYLDYLYSLWQDIPLLPNRSYYGQAGIDRKSVEDYQMLQYDLLFGQSYQYGGALPVIRQEGYFLGREKILLENVRLLEGEKGKGILDKRTLLVRGENFPPQAKLYLNGRLLPTDFVDEQHLTAVVAKKVLQKSEEVMMQVKLADSLDVIIAESNCVILDKMLK